MKYSPLNGNYDATAREHYKQSKSSLVFWIIASSYAYYHLDRSLLSDNTFDNMCKTLLDKWDEIGHNSLKHLVSKEDMKAGTLYALERWKYPRGVIRIVESLVDTLDSKH